LLTRPNGVRLPAQPLQHPDRNVRCNRLTQWFGTKRDNGVGRKNHVWQTVVTSGDDILCFGSGNRYRVNRVWSLVETIFDVRNPDLERNPQCPQCILTPRRPRR